IQLLLPERSYGTDDQIIHLGAAHEPGPARQADQEAWVHLPEQSRAQAVVATGPPLPAGRLAAAVDELRQPAFPVAIVGPGLARGAGAIAVVIACGVGEDP